MAKKNGGNGNVGNAGSTQNKGRPTVIQHLVEEEDHQMKILNNRKNSINKTRMDSVQLEKLDSVEHSTYNGEFIYYVHFLVTL